jgi:hypothetical protein
MLMFFSSFQHARIVRPNAFLEGAILGGYIVTLLAVSKLWFWEDWHPELKIRQRPKPEITLGLGLPDPKNIKK